MARRSHRWTAAPWALRGSTAAPSALRVGTLLQTAWSAVVCCCLLLLTAAPAAAQTPAQGFSLNRYEPTPAGEWSFWVDRPWYSGTRLFAAGLTLNYSHEPLVFGSRLADGSFTRLETVLSHQLIGHLDLAVSFRDRVTVSATVPVILLERGQEFAGIKPIDGVAVGDPRLGGMVRVWRQPDADPISVSLGLFAWIPVRGIDSSLPQQSSDSGVRFMPKLALAGVYRRLHWAATVAFMYRPDAVLGNLQSLSSMATASGSSAGAEVQLGGALYYADMERRFKVGPELMFGTVVTNGNGFRSDYSSLELLIGGHYSLFQRVMLGLAGGFGALHAPGTPDFRMLLRVAWAPFAQKHRVVITEPEPEVRPLPDRDEDGVPDAADECADVPQGPKPDPQHRGCPAGDRDRDGIVDHEDQCPDEPAGMHPDPARAGCPLPDRDHDNVPDDRDACPDQPGAPHPDPRKNGCPSKAEVKGGQIVIIEPVFFATNKDVILERSYPVLQAVADALLGEPSIKKVMVEGHTDSRGSVAYNTDLSDRRARSVLKWLSERGVDPSRMEARGYGPSRPIRPNTTDAGRAANRRVEFHIVDPPTGLPGK